jgi:hypothetical protein
MILFFNPLPFHHKKIAHLNLQLTKRAVPPGTARFTIYH